MTEFKNNVQCMYAVVRFMPFAETREFANVGVVVIAPKFGLYDFKLAPQKLVPQKFAPQKLGLVTQFFDDLDGMVYKYAIEGFEAELERVRNYLVHNYVQGKD